MFTDTVQFKAIAGKGGNGAVAFRREKYIPKGGPSGGNGGRGGSINIKASRDIFALDALRTTRHIKGAKGGDGGGASKIGRTGKDTTIFVPLGTFIKNAETGELIADLTDHNQSLLICEGGRGGRGNESFKSSKNRAPRFSSLGDDGEEKVIQLELKLIADIGLVGFPNAGKSTLLNAITAVSVKAAPYPFTTLHPNLSYIEYPNYTRTYIADIPGIIKGAHENKGLGSTFLRHIERTHVLLILIDISVDNINKPSEEYTTLMNELKEYDPQLLEKPRYVVLNKIDVKGSEKEVSDFFFDTKLPEKDVFIISAQEKIRTASLIEHIRSLGLSK